jgi:hypothetical protein
MSEPVLENGIPVDEAAPVEEPAVETAEPAGETQPTQGAPWAPDPEEWQQLTGTVQQLAENLRPVPVQPEPPGINDYFPVDPATGETTLTLEGLDRMVQDRAEALVGQRLGMFEPVLNQTVADRGEQLINQKFDSLAEAGDFDRTLARELAEGYASTGMDPNVAIERAAERARGFAQAQRQQGVDEYKTTLQNIGSAPREPGVAGAGVAGEEPLPLQHPDRYKQVADNFVARHKLG